MRDFRARWMLVMGMAIALFASACASILNPHPPPDPANLDLSERRLMNRSIMADPDPVPNSAWPWVEGDAGAAAAGLLSP